MGRLVAGRYQLERRLGSGRLSEVWQGTDLQLARPVAIKLLDGDLGGNGRASELFREQARRAAPLVHEGIARVFDYGEPDCPDGLGGPFLVMEMVDGPSLADLLAGGALSTVRSMDVVAQVAAALEVAHRVGLVHGDVRPQHVLVNRDGIVKLVGFVTGDGIEAALVSTADRLGDNLAYLAPERSAGAKSTRSCDLYALGVMAYQCITGTVPYAGADMAVAHAHCRAPMRALPRSVPEPVHDLVRSLIAEDPADRPASAGQVAAQAGMLRDQLAFQALAPPVVEAAVSGPPRLAAGPFGAGARPVRRRLTGRVFVAIAIVLAVLAAVILLRPNGRSPRADRVTQVAMVTVNAAGLAGQPVSAVQSRLENLGLAVRVRWQPTGQLGPGRVISVSPAGRLPVGSLVTLVGSLPPASLPPSRPGPDHVSKRIHRYRGPHSVAGLGSPVPAPAPRPASGGPAPSPSPTTSSAPSTSAPPPSTSAPPPSTSASPPSTSPPPTPSPPPTSSSPASSEPAWYR